MNDEVNVVEKDYDHDKYDNGSSSGQALLNEIGQKATWHDGDEVEFFQSEQSWMVVMKWS